MTLPDVQSLFKRHFGCTPTHVVRAPGCVELLGVREFCAEGLGISASINKFIHVASTPRADGKVELVSTASMERETFRADEIRLNPAAPWADGIKRVLAQLRRRGVKFSGFRAAVCDDLPPGVDPGGAALFGVAAALTLRQLYPFSLSETGLAPPPQRNAKGGVPPLATKEKLLFADLWRSTDTGEAGAGPSWCDAICSLCGKAWHVLSLDLRFRTVEPAPMTGEVIVICTAETPGGQSTAASLGSGGLRSAGESAAAKLGAKSLRSIEPGFLKAGRSKLSADEYECAAHTVGEMARVVAAERALRADDHQQFGQFMFQSEESSRSLLRTRSPQIEALIALARSQPGCLGARRCAGPAAATVNLVSHHQADRFMRQMVEQYHVRTGEKLVTYLCQTVDGSG